MKVYISILVLCYLTPHRVSSHTHNKLFLLLVDGFRWDYIDKYATQAPNLRSMIRRGVRAESVIPPFPSVTCTSLTTILTGTHAQKHGIMGNFVYDHNLKQPMIWPCLFSNWLVTSQAEMLPITALKNGIKYRIVPGNSSENSLTSNERIKRGIIKLVEEDAQFVISYVFLIDKAGHAFGPESTEMAVAVRKFDQIIGSVFRYLRCRHMMHRVNIIIGSDHGMAATDPVNKVIRVQDCVDVNDIAFMSPSPAASIFPKSDSMVASLYDSLKNCHQNWTVYLKEDIPERFKYKNNDRVGPILVIADEGWQITSPLNSQYETPEFPIVLERGVHGYDNMLTSMGASFFASGPNFKQCYRQPTFHLVHVLPLFTKILGIPPPANIDGSLDAVKGMLRNI